MELREGTRRLDAGMSDELWSDHQARHAYVRDLIRTDCTKCNGYVDVTREISIVREWSDSPHLLGKIVIFYRLSLTPSALPYPEHVRFADLPSGSDKLV